MSRPRRPRLSLGWLVSAADRAGRAALPAALAVLLMVVAATPPDLPSAVPAVAFASVLFWTLFRPAAMGPAVAFGLGLLQDLLTFGPLGAGVLTLLLTHAAAMRWRRVLARQSFLVVWLAVAGFAAGAVAVGFALQALLTFAVPPVAPAVQLFLLSVGFYPPLALLFTRLHRRLERAEAAA
ncbi:MAG: rod shape-determining protein MreD [Acetobacteraceae bacterium]|nr:rod shape-determining protein MreD [Acetobacteraceae bacterium]MDW8398114.1 rod shape-determining protein MreD [Acetobacteraceae bacterium]